MPNKKRYRHVFRVVVNLSTKDEEQATMALKTGIEDQLGRISKVVNKPQYLRKIKLISTKEII